MKACWSLRVCAASTISARRGSARPSWCVRSATALSKDAAGFTTPRGFAAADRVVGRAAAFLYVLLGAGEIYAGVMSDTAADVLERFGVAVFSIMPH